MKPENVFQLELATVFASGRSLFMKLGYAYLLGLPFALITMPVRVRVIGIVVLILFTSFFGAATTLVSRRSDGQLSRLKLLPIRRNSLYSDILFSGAAVDLLQVGLVIFLLLLINGRNLSLQLVLTIAGTLVLSVLFLNLLGMLLGAVSNNSQEVHLIGSIGVGLIGFLSGIYLVPSTIEGVIDTISLASPLRYLARSLSAGMGESTGGILPIHALLSTLLLMLLIGVFLMRGLHIRPSGRNGASSLVRGGGNNQTQRT